MKTVSLNGLNIPEDILETFRLASKKPVKIILADAKAASNLRFRFHNYRKQMRAIGDHPDLVAAEKVSFRIELHSLIAEPERFTKPIKDALAQAKKRRKSIGT